MGEMTSTTEIRDPAAPAVRLHFRSAGLTDKEATGGSTAYEAEAEGVKYRIVGDLIPGRMNGARAFRAYRVAGLGGHSLVPAADGRKHARLADAKLDAEADLAEVLRDRAPEAAPPTPVAEALSRAAAAVRAAAEAIGTVTLAQRAGEPDPATDDDVDELVERIVRRAQYQALRVMARVARDWYDGSRSNHQAMAHNAVADCCAHFELGEILRMVNDAAVELSVPIVAQQ